MFMNTSKFRIKQSLFTLLLCVWFMPAFGQGYATGIVVTGHVEKGNNSDVSVSYILTVEKESVSSCRTLYITPRLVGEGKDLSFSPVVVKGKSRNQAYERWVTLNGGEGLLVPVHACLTVDRHLDQEVDFSTVVAYEEWMDGAELIFEERVFYCGREEDVSNRSLAYLSKAEGETEEEIEVEAIIPVAPVVNEYRTKEGVAYIAFEQGKSIIRPLFGNNREELGKISDLIRQISEDETAQIVAIELTGYASPEGRFAFNLDLSRRRTEAAMNYINDEYDLYLPQKRMKCNSEGEDWEGLSRLLEDKYIPYRNEVMKVMDNRMDPDQKDSRLKSIGGGEVYRILLQDFYPSLRRTEYKIQYKTRKY